MPDDWYDVVPAEARLTQGDLISDCPLISWSKANLESINSSSLKAATEAIQADVVVLTQACDLEHGKVDNVLLCPHIGLSEFKCEWESALREALQNPTPKAWRSQCDDIRDGFVWNMSLLQSSNHADLPMEHRVVDFKDVFTVPREFVESYLIKRGERRLRLRPPYREHLSQAFARFFMRVGLPVSVSTAW